MTDKQTTLTDAAPKSKSNGDAAAPAAAAAPAKPAKVRERVRVESMMAAPWKPETVGDCLEGIYQGMEMVPGKGKRKPFASYHVMKPDGERVRVASAMLNSKLNQIKKGTYIWLTYKGMFETSNGDSPDYEVEIEKGAELIDPLRGDGDIHEERAD